MSLSGDYVTLVNLVRSVVLEKIPIKEIYNPLSPDQ